MARPFSPWDIPLARRLQGKYLALDLERELLSTPSPLTGALREQLSLGRRRSFTYILEESTLADGQTGLVQFRASADAPEGDILYLAPRPEECAQAPAIWGHLLEQVVAKAGEQGIWRLYAKLPEGAPEGREAFQRAGFATYAWEDIFKWDGPSEEIPSPGGQVSLIPSRYRFSWELERLYGLSAPPPVQQAEGPLDRDFRQAGTCSFLLGKDGEIVGALSYRRGPKGSWIRFLLDPMATAPVQALSQEALAELREGVKLPLYCGVRHYQGGLGGALEEVGFCLWGRQHLLMRPIAVSVKHAVPAGARGLKKRAVAIPWSSLVARWNKAQK